MGEEWELLFHVAKAGRAWASVGLYVNGLVWVSVHMPFSAQGSFLELSRDLDLCSGLM